MTRLKLAVVTHTRTSGVPHRWYEGCMRSVHQGLPAEAVHVVINCNSHAELPSARWDALDLAEYVCFVDDDDQVIGDSISVCLQALEEKPHLGIAFTDERYVGPEGQTLESPHGTNRVVRYPFIHKSPQVIHHLVMIRTDMVDRSCRAMCERIGMGDEWVIKGGTALRHGAIHIPRDGYEWRQYPEQSSRELDWVTGYSKKLHIISAYLAAQTHNMGQIEQYKP